MKSKNSLARPEKPKWILADHEIPGTGGLRSMHVDPSAVTLEEAMRDPVAKKVLEIGVIAQILNEIDDVNAAAWHADRWDETKYFQKRGEDGRSPFLRFSTVERLIDGINAAYPWYIESIGIGGNFRYHGEVFQTDVTYDFANRQPTKVLASILAGQDEEKAKRAVYKLPKLIMPEGKFYLSEISLESIERLGDYEERKRAIGAAVLRGYIRYGGAGKPMYDAWMDLIERANSSSSFVPRKFYLRVNESFAHHSKIA